MKNWILDNWLSITLTFIVITLLFVGSGMIIKSQQSEARNQIIQTELIDEVKQYEDHNGELVNQKQALEIDRRNLKDNLDALGIDNKELKKQIGSLKNLVGRLHVKASASGSGEVVDTVDNISVIKETASSGNFTLGGDHDWSNDYMRLTINEYVVTGRYDFSDSSLNISNVNFNANFTYIYDVNFTSTSYWKRDKKWQVWKSKYLVTDIKFIDPSVTVTDAQSIIIKPNEGLLKKKWFWACVGGAAGFFLAK